MRLPAVNLPRFSAVLPLAVLVLGVLSPAAQAKTTDRNAPMDVEADRTDATISDSGDAILTGNVKITQGTLDVQADRAVIHRAGGDISEVTLTGNPATLNQVNDNGEAMNARAAQIVYTLSSDLVVLTGGVVVEQPRGTLRGETIKYDLKTGHLDGGGDGKRVQMRIMPRTAVPKSAVPNTAAPKTAGPTSAAPVPVAPKTVVPKATVPKTKTPG